jgi:hypothetical protein
VLLSLMHPVYSSVRVTVWTHCVCLSHGWHQGTAQ